MYEVFENKNEPIQNFGMWIAERWQWDWGGAEDLSGNGADRMNELKEILLGITPTSRSGDRWIWGPGRTKTFTVNSCYSWLVNTIAGEREAILDNEVVLACSKVWRSNVPTKAIVLVWRLLIHKQPTRDALMRRGILTSSHDSCSVFCFGAEENIAHFVFQLLALPRGVAESFHMDKCTSSSRSTSRAALSALWSNFKRAKAEVGEISYLDCHNLGSMASEKQDHI